MDINWGNVLAAAVPAVVSAGSGMLQSSISQDRENDKLALANENAREDQIFQLKLAALKARYSGGGGSGGSGIDPNKLTKAQHITTIQNQGTSQQDAIKTLIDSMQKSYSLAGRG